jgi:23S rRNA pseudouridine1911/1915/1917 synthase
MWSTIGGAERPGIVHRLDRGTSGVMVVARNDAAHRHLAAQFKNREVEKVYLAIVWGLPRSDRFTVEAPLGRDRVSRLRISTRSSRPRAASTELRVSRRFRGFALLEARPRTGRTHQIRAHLLHAGHPIVGDAVYGGARWKNLPAGPLRERIRALGRLGLHAHRLAFTHPVTGLRLSFEAPLPEDLVRLLEEMESL